MPQALVDKVVASSKFNTGYTTVEYLSAAIVDMELHTLPGGDVDPDAFERETLERIGAPKEVAMRHRLPQFNHLFTSDSYSAGLLQLPLVGGDGRRHPRGLRRSGGTTSTRRRPPSCASSSSRREHQRSGRGLPAVPRPGSGRQALLKKRGFPTTN
jgi:hypothetical protein